MTDILPKVFISHASEDKDRFVRSLATALRTNGIDAWYDEWEIGPGDSIVKKVFVEGLDASKVFIAVLSKISISKPWVQNELDAATVKRIEQDAKIVSVVIDNLSHEEIPLSLRMLRYVRIADINNYDPEFQDILGAILGLNVKPSLGNLPLYLVNSYPAIPGLTNTDSLVLQVLGQKALETGHTSWISIDSIELQLSDLSIPFSVYNDSLMILDDQGLIEAKSTLNGTTKVVMVKFSDRGFDTYLLHNFDGYPELIRRVGLMIANHNMTKLETIAEALGIPLSVGYLAIKMLTNRGFISSKSYLSGSLNAIIFNVRPTLNRWLDTDS